MGRDDKIYVYRTLKWEALNYNVFYLANYVHFQNLSVYSDEEVNKKSTVKRNEEDNSIWYYPD